MKKPDRIMTGNNYLTYDASLYYRKRIAGEFTSKTIARLTGYTDVYVRQLLNRIVPVTRENTIILETIENCCPDNEFKKIAV